MELNEKLQKLRLGRGLTQEELAAALYVSRTAVSKWESGRGYPNIDSLKAIAKFFSVSLDELLSSDEVLSIAEEDRARSTARLRDVAVGLVDLCAALLLFLPLFGARTGGGVHAVALLSLTGIAPYLRIAYFAAVIANILTGVAMLALQGCTARAWVASKTVLSMALGALLTLLFTVSLQPYAAVFSMALLIVKIFLLIKRA